MVLFASLSIITNYYLPLSGALALPRNLCQMDMFSEIIQNMYGITLPVFIMNTLEGIIYLISFILLFFIALKLNKNVKNEYSKYFLLSIFLSVLISFLFAIFTDFIDYSEYMFIIEMLNFILAILMLVSVMCLRKIFNQYIELSNANKPLKQDK